MTHIERAKLYRIAHALLMRAREENDLFAIWIAEVAVATVLDNLS